MKRMLLAPLAGIDEWREHWWYGLYQLVLVCAVVVLTIIVAMLLGLTFRALT